jgi:hypothetical protein
MKRLPIIILFLASFNAFSQPGTVTLRFCPLALVDDISFPTIQGGVEYGLSKKLAWYNEVGIKYKSSYYEGADTSYVKSSGFKIKTELRYYYKRKTENENSKKSKTQLYFGVNLFYVKDWHDTEVPNYKNKDTSLYRIDNLGVKKNIFGLNILSGIQLPIFKNLLFDTYAGFGIRFSYIDNVNQEYNPDKDEMLHSVDFTVIAAKNSIETDQGFHTKLNLTCGFRLCYRF